MAAELESDSRWERALYVTFAVLAGLLLLLFHFVAIESALDLTGVFIDAPEVRVFFAVGVGVPTLLVDIWLFRQIKDQIQVYRWTRERLDKESKGGEGH